MKLGEDVSLNELMPWAEPIGACRRNPNQKMLGAFYTPPALSDILVEWAVRNADDRVLEPGFGGCGFIESAFKRLAKLGASDPGSQIFGCDVDDQAYLHLRNIGLFANADIARQFPKLDFMNAEPSITWSNCDAVVGNPPYVSYQLIGSSNRAAYQAALLGAGFCDVSARASLWAYFVLHAMSFLKKGGNAAWVLPGSFLQANYAQSVRIHMSRHFDRVFVCRIRDRLFLDSGAEEETVVVLAEGYEPRDSDGRTTEKEVENLEEFADAVDQWKSLDLAKLANQTPEITGVGLGGFLTRRIGDVIRARIGLVTGDNSFFLLSIQRANELGIRTRSLTPVLGKFPKSPGLSFSHSDLMALSAAGGKCWMVSRAQLPSGSKAIDSYLLSYAKEKIANTSTFRSRKVWFCPDDGRVPDAFWPVMRDLGPRLLVNKASINCTNTVHRIYLAPGGTRRDLILAQIGLISTVGQVSAELNGRHYGSGVLKHEPRDVEKIEVPWAAHVKSNALTSLLRSVDFSLRNGDEDGARKKADGFLLEHMPGITEAYVRTQTERLEMLRRKRFPPWRAR